MSTSDARARSRDQQAGDANGLHLVTAPEPEGRALRAIRLFLSLAVPVWCQVETPPRGSEAASGPRASRPTEPSAPSPILHTGTKAHPSSNGVETPPVKDRKCFEETCTALPKPSFNHPPTLTPAPAIRALASAYFWSSHERSRGARLSLPDLLHFT